MGDAGGTTFASYKCTLNDDCIVSVHVEPVGPASCKITTDPAMDVALEMKSNGLSSLVSHQIRWVLDDASQDAKYRFVDEPKGVILKSSTPDTSGQFFKQKAKNGGREFQWRDNNSDRQTYDYTIHIYQKDSRPLRECSLDPRIWNN